MKIGDKFRGKILTTENTIWEVTKITKKGNQTAICRNGNMYWSKGICTVWNLSDTQYFEPYFEKSNNFKLIYDILNNP